MDFVKVMAVGASPKANDAWQRRVGGVLKDLAYVSKGYIRDIKRMNPDLVVFYNNGEMERSIEKTVEGTGIKMLGLNLTLMPATIKELYRISNEKRIGVVMEHLKCANILLSEILTSGFFENHFLTGTFAEMPEMDVDAFVAGEELTELIEQKQKNSTRHIIEINRGLSPYSVAALVNTVTGIAGNRARK